jgi:hypothetical protein
MVADGLLTRQRYREVPPRVDYELTERARDLLPVVGALARWGARWAWSPPRPDEAIDIGAILRTVPGLTLPDGVEGMVEVTVVRRAGDMKRYVLTARRGQVEVAERSAPEADAKITGPERAWVEALGPDSSRTELEITGDREIADAFLDALARWGYQWAWSPPRPEEAVDIGAIFRSVPGLAVPAGFDGSAELTVSRRDGQQKRYVLSARDGELHIDERSAPDADARIAGPERAWVEALGPDASRTGLEISGDRRRADALLDGLAPLAIRDAAVA